MRARTIALLIAGLVLVGTTTYLRFSRQTEPIVRPSLEQKQKYFIFNRTDGMQITSSAFLHNSLIPVVYTCDGDGISPPLAFTGVPAEAKSLAFFIDDPDVPKSIMPDGMFDHWVVWNIPPSSTGIGEGEVPSGVVGSNTAGSRRYYNPCPPDSEHRYFFRLYALDTLLDLPAGSTKAAAQQAMEGHILDSAELIGRYRRQ